MTLVYPQVVTGADLLRGINKLDYLAPLLKRRGATAVAIVNSKLYGIRSFYKVMKKYGIRPVIGLSILCRNWRRGSCPSLCLCKR